MLFSHQIYASTTAASPSTSPAVASAPTSRKLSHTHIDLLHVHICGHPVSACHALPLHRQGQIFRHDSIHVDSLYTSCLEVICEVRQLWSIVKLSAEGETSSPGEDRGDRVGGGLLAFLVLPVVTCHLRELVVGQILTERTRRPMSRFGLHSKTIGRYELARHHTETAESLS